MRLHVYIEISLAVFSLSESKAGCVSKEREHARGREREILESIHGVCRVFILKVTGPSLLRG